MTLKVHTITAGQVLALADGTGTEVLDTLKAAQRSKCLIMLALVVRMAAQAGHPQAPAARAGWRLLTRVQRQAPGAAQDMLCHPSVGAWATDCVQAFRSQQAADTSPAWLALVAAAAAIRGDVPCSVHLSRSVYADAALHLPTLGTVTLPDHLRGDWLTLHHSPRGTGPSGTGLSGAGPSGTWLSGTWLSGGGPSGQHARVALPRRLDGDAPGWRALTRVSLSTGGQRSLVVIDDADPYRLAGYDAPLERLDAGTREEWPRRLRGGWRILARDHPRTATDVVSLIRTLVPTSDADGTVSSVTTRHAFGSVGLSLPGDDVSMALTLAHEVQHAKLAALMDLLPMVTDSAPALFYAPWRSDPRPLASLLQGVYAHLGVARFWRRRREVATDPAEVFHANVEFARWRLACAQAADFIAGRPELTRYGSVFVDGMTHVLRGWRRDHVPPEAQARAEQAIRAHRRQWG